MTTYRYTHSTTGETVDVYAAGASHAASKLADARRPVIDARLAAQVERVKGGLKTTFVNTIQAVRSADGVWVESVDRGDRYEDTGNRLRITYKLGSIVRPYAPEQTERPVVTPVFTPIEPRDA